MSTVAPRLMTTEEMLALPENGMDRELIRGELREQPLTPKDRKHCRACARISFSLEGWLEQQPEPRGEVGGEAGFRLRRNPDTTVGIDVAYVAPEVVATHPESVFYEGPPVLAVEVLSPSDSQERISEKVQIYQEAGVPLVWLVDPVFKTVLAHRRDDEPTLYNVRQEISAEPYVPGFRALVAKFFAI